MRMLWALGPLPIMMSSAKLESRVQDFFDLTRQAVDLINKKNVALLQVRQQGGQVAGLLDGRTDVMRICTPISCATMPASVVLPRPGGP